MKSPSVGASNVTSPWFTARPGPRLSLTGPRPGPRAGPRRSFPTLVPGATAEMGAALTSSGQAGSEGVERAPGDDRAPAVELHDQGLGPTPLRRPDRIGEEGGHDSVDQTRDLDDVEVSRQGRPRGSGLGGPGGSQGDADREEREGEGGNK